MYHVTPTNQVRKCSAKTPESCKYARQDPDTPHFVDATDAASYVHEKNMKESTIKTGLVKHSSLEDSGLGAKKGSDYGQIPSKFFSVKEVMNGIGESTPIKVEMLNELSALIEKGEGDSNKRQMALRKFSGISTVANINTRLCEILGSTKDSQVPVEKLVETAGQLGVKDIQVLDENFGYNINSSIVITGKVGNMNVLIGNGVTSDQTVREYFVRQNRGETGDLYTLMSPRTLMGASRLANIPGVNFRCDDLFGDTPDVSGKTSQQQAEEYEAFEMVQAGRTIRNVRAVMNLQCEGKKLVS